ncbi:MAG TPA: ornithine cyclodeaminase family protein [Gemmatimonadales bacterium]|nr:ornithine cyclodeaminase family protein [Gemmatimonadales bacterium]
MESPTTLLLTRSEVAGLLSMAECIAAVESVFKDYAEGLVPPPGLLGFHAPTGGFHLKVASTGQKRGFFAAKVNSNFPGNPKDHGLPTIQGVIALFDLECGRLLALMDSGGITALRTAAATGVAAKYLAREDAATAAICGCGVQGRLQLEAVHQVRPLTGVHCFDQDPSRADKFAREMGQKLGIPVRAAAQLATATMASDIIVTCTPARQHFLGPAQVRPGSFIAAVGADNPEKQEIDPALMGQATVVVDNLEQCRTIGDLHHAIEAGVMSAGQVAADLGGVVAGKHPGRRTREEIIVFDSTGTALQDVAAAAIVYQRALERPTGTVQLGA